MPTPNLTIEQRRALQIIRDNPNGCTQPALEAQGFAIGLMIGLVGAGFVNAKPHVMKAGGLSFGVVRFAITNAGRRAIERVDSA